MAIEPAYQGHQYYPLPALRIGPSIADVLACSHLCTAPIELPLLEIGDCRLVSPVYRSYDAWLRAWSGLRAERGAATLLPVHPWHLKLSPVLRVLLAKGVARISPHRIAAIPLASQRTCRIVGTGFDVKMPVAATLTGEFRLLYRLNCENAPMISVLARHLRGADGASDIDFQADVASIFHAEPALAPHLSAIVRTPVPRQKGETIIPAINLWSGPCRALALLRGADPARVEEFFHRYCMALMTGPVRYCAEWGMAFEPHLQNVYVALRDGMPSRIILRDLDASVLDPRRIRPVLRDLGLDLAKDTWHAMPSFEIGSKRMIQAMLFGHLGEVMWCLTQCASVPSGKFAAIVQDCWRDLAARAPSLAARRAVHRLRGWSDAVKATLRTRLTRATVMEFVTP